MVVNVKCPKDLGPVDIAQQKPVLPKRSEGMSLARNHRRVCVAAFPSGVVSFSL
jgi:hypothetical protein